MYTDSNLILTQRTLEYSVYSAIPPNRVTPKAAMLLLVGPKLRGGV